MNTFYSRQASTAFTSEQMLSLFGIDTAVMSVEILNDNGFYPVTVTVDETPSFLYSSDLEYTISGTNAIQVWVPVPRSLPIAKENAKTLIGEQAQGELERLYFTTGTTAGILASVASQAVIDRPAVYQTVLDAANDITENSAGKLDAVSTATSVDEINNVVNPPTGTLFTGRGAGEAPLDLNVSYYTLFNSVSMTEADTELYVPGTSTVIPYGSSPGGFDFLGDCFTLGNYLLQIRETATGSVIAEFECPLAPAGENVSF